MPASKMVVDFTKVKEQGNFNPRHKPEGDYLMTIKKVDDHTSKEGNKGWVYTLVPVEDQRASYPYYCNNDAKQAWKIRNLFVAAGITVPKKRVNVDPNKVVGKTIGASLEDDQYEGRMKSVVQQVFPDTELDLAEDTPANNKRSTTKRRAQPVDDDDEDDIEDLDDDEEDDEEEEPAPRRKKRRTTQTRTTTKRRAKPPVDDDDDDDDVDELDLEEL